MRGVTCSVATAAVVVATVLAAPAAGHPPALGVLPSNMTVEATSAEGATVNFASPSATHGGSSVPVTCTPASGTVFALGTTTVTCSAEDPASHETSSGTFNVAVVDRTPPTVTGGDDRTVEATGPDGAVVRYELPVANDLVDGVRPVVCAPAPGSRLKLGTTTIKCSTADTRGNSTTGEFKITVVDTTAPTFDGLPDDVEEEINGPGPVVVEYETPTATDSVDGNRVVTCKPKSGTLFPLGVTTVLCTASDTRRNRTSTTFAVTVFDATPPPAPLRVAATNAKGATTVTWQLPASTDIKGVELVRRPGRAGARTSVLYRGRGNGFVDRDRPTTGAYTYEVATFDFADNRSKPAVAEVKGTQSALLSPPEGARLTALPLLRWLTVPKASYYNVQLYRRGVKILSTWPRQPSLRLRPRWTYAGRQYKLGPGSYRWYVWPGFGSLRQARYGPLIGQSSFVIVVAPG